MISNCCEDAKSPSCSSLSEKDHLFSPSQANYQERLTTVLIGNQVVVRKFTIQEYYRMAEVGIIRPSERVELLNGRIIQFAPSSPRHQTIVDKLTEIL